MEAALTESECFGTTILGKSDFRKGDPITVGSRVVVFQAAVGVRLATGGARTFRVGVIHWMSGHPVGVVDSIGGTTPDLKMFG